MSRLSKLLFVVLSFVLSLSAFAGVSDYLEPAKLKGTIKKEIARLDIKTKLKLLDLDVVDGINISSKYIYNVEPSYQNGFYTRIDTWNLEANVSPGDLLGQELTPVYLNIKKGSNVTFVRQFKTQKEALVALPMSPHKLPVTSQRVLELKPGTFVSIPTSLNLIVGANAAFSQGMLNAGIGSNYLISGEFLIHIFRLGENKVRLKLIALNKTSKGIQANAGVGMNVFGVSLIDNEINKLIDTNLFRIGMAKAKGDLFVIDYLLDLDDERAQKIYNSLLGSTFKFKRIKQLQKFIKDKKDSESLITNLDEVEALYREERQKSPDLRVVDRQFKGTNKFSQRNRNFKVGMNLIKFGRKKQYSENFMTFDNEQDQKEHMVYNVNSRTNENGLIFGLFKEEKRHSTYMLLKANKDGSIKENGLTDYGFTYDMKDKEFRQSEQTKLKDYLSANLPEVIRKGIDWSKFVSDKTQQNAKVYYQFLFDRKVLEILRDMPEVDIWKCFNTYLSGVESRGIDTHITNHRVAKISHILAAALSSETESADRREKVESYLKMSKYQAFRRYGMGLILSILSKEDIEKYVYFKMIWSSNKLKTREYSFGNNPRTDLFTTMEFVQSVINNRSFDLRLVGYDPERAAELN